MGHPTPPTPLFLEHESLRHFLEFVPEAALVGDSEGRIVFVNRNAEKLFGYQASELQGQPIERLIPQRFRHNHVEQRSQFKEHPRTRPMGGQETDLYALRKNGSEFSAEISLSPMHTDQGILVISVVRDISEKKQVLKRLNLLQSINESIAEAKNFNSALEIVLRRICEATAWDYGEAWMQDSQDKMLVYSPSWFGKSERLRSFREKSEGLKLRLSDHMIGQVWESKQGLWVKDIAQQNNFFRMELAKKAGFKGAFAIPIVSSGTQEIVAVLLFLNLQNRAQDQSSFELISMVCAQLGLPLQKKQTEEALHKAHIELEQRVAERTESLCQANAILKEEVRERQKAQEEILGISEKLQQRIGQELHDDVGQKLTAASYLTQLLQTKLTEKNQPEALEATDIKKLLKECITEIRGFSRGLYPAMLSQHGLVFSVQELAAAIESSCRISCRVEHNEAVEKISEPMALQLYRIVQESVHNAVKHSKPKQIQIHLKGKNNMFHLTVQDDGCGIQQPTPSGLGLQIMKYRAELIGAQFDIQSCQGQGTVVQCSAKLEALIK